MPHTTRRQSRAFITFARLSAGLALAAQAACASSGAANGAGGAQRYDRVSTTGVYYGESSATPTGVIAHPVGLPMLRNTSHLITSGQIGEVRAATAYDAVVRLRPQLLQTARGSRLVDGRPARPRVYIDGTFQGEPDVLQSIAAHAVFDIRYVAPIDAASWLGAGHEGGALFVRLRRSW